ncbi:MAG: hypothetical protein CMD99_03320 [Gammaproteobacteria bacterium]|nr:hypothetical protein [Gammaproteobacteria bacterium]
MSITFTSSLLKPSGITASPSGLKRPGFGTLYGFDVPKDTGTASFANRYAIQFDGVDDNISCSIPTSLMASDFTTSIWVRFSANDTADGSIWANNYGATGKVGWRLYFDSTDAAGNGNLSVWASNGSGAYDNPISNVQVGLGVDTWSNLAWGRNSGTHFLYVNGSQVTISQGHQGFNSSSSSYSDSSPDLRIFEPTIGNGPSAGYCDEAAIWNVALSGSDISAIRDTSGANPIPTDLSSIGNSGNGPIVWWRMSDNNNGSGTTVSNAQNIGTNDATLNNSPTLHDLSTAPDTIYIA